MSQESGVNWNKPFAASNPNWGPSYKGSQEEPSKEPETDKATREAEFKAMADKLDKKKQKKKKQAWGHVDKTVAEGHKPKNIGTSVKSQFKKDKSVSKEEKKDKAWDDLSKTFSNTKKSWK